MFSNYKCLFTFEDDIFLLLLHIRNRNSYKMQEEFYRQMLRQYGGEVMTFIRRIVSQQSDAEDLAQDTFIKAFRSIDSFDSSRGTMRHWLLGIAYREVLMHLRRQKYRTCYLEDDERILVTISDDEADRLLSEKYEKRIRTLEESIQRLSPEDQTLLQLYYIDGMHLQQIAGIVGHDAAYLANRMHRIRKRLCVMIKTKETDGEE